MSNAEWLAKKVEGWAGFGCIIFWLFSILYISQNKITDLGDKFTILNGSLLTFVAVFYTVTIVSEFLTKLNRLNIKDKNRLKAEIKKLNKKENINLFKERYDENIEACNKKISFYNELSNIKNRKINSFLFLSAFILIVTLILDSKFIPDIILNIQKSYILISGLWFVIYYILQIILLFYKAYSD